MSFYDIFTFYTAKSVVIATIFAVVFGRLNINAYLCTAKIVAIATKFAVRLIKTKELWL